MTIEHNHPSGEGCTVRCLAQVDQASICERFDDDLCECVEPCDPAAEVPTEALAPLSDADKVALRHAAELERVKKYAYADGVAAGRAQADDEANARILATRRLATDANAALRAKLLAALGIEDDGRTSLADYVDALVADRDAAYDRGRAQAAADPELILRWLQEHHDAFPIKFEEARYAIADPIAEVRCATEEGWPMPWTAEGVGGPPPAEGSGDREAPDSGEVNCPERPPVPGDDTSHLPGGDRTEGTTAADG